MNKAERKYIKELMQRLEAPKDNYEALLNSVIRKVTEPLEKKLQAIKDKPPYSDRAFARWFYYEACINIINGYRQKQPLEVSAHYRYFVEANKTKRNTKRFFDKIREPVDIISALMITNGYPSLLEESPPQKSFKILENLLVEIKGKWN